TAVAPSMFVPLTVGIIVVAVVMRSRAKVLLWTPLLAAATLLPAVVRHNTDLRAIFADPVAPAGFDASPAWPMLLGLAPDTVCASGLAELPWLDVASASLPWTGIFIGVVTGPLLVAAIIGAIAPGIGGNLARAGLLTEFIGLIAAIVNANIFRSEEHTSELHSRFG